MAQTFGLRFDLSRTPVRRRIALLCVVAGGAVVYGCFDPATAGFFPPCPFRAVTGLLCPGCGTQRALHALLNGNLPEALQLNALVVVSLPLAALTAVYPPRRPPGGYLQAWWVGGLIVLTAAFFVLRNVVALSPQP